MMDYPELIILDVGHGNSALIRDQEKTIVIDCARGTAVNDAIEKLEIKKIDSVLISHGDADHVGGLIQLLLNKEIEISKIYLNPDVPKTKSTKLWEDLRVALADSIERNSTKTHSSLTTNENGEIDFSDIKLEILYPDEVTALTGAGGKSLTGRKLSSNTMSVVIRILHKDFPVALFPADIDQTGLDRILEKKKSLDAGILVFPHHGGLPGNANPKKFAEKICSEVEPNIVVFSVSRGHKNTPLDEIIEGINIITPDAHIMCTQLAKKCMEEVDPNLTHFNETPGKGKARGCSCSGTIRLKLDGNKTNFDSIVSPHLAFIQNNVETPVCFE